jgi:membrane associated rhomboid family serine protease
MLPLASQWRSRSSAFPHRQKLSAGRGYSTLGPMQQQQPTRLQETLSKIPLCTTLITLLCLILQLCVVILGWNVNLFSISYAAVVYDHEYYRLFTSAYFHLGLFHIAMNMLSFVGIGAWLEMRMGTMYFFLTILWSTILTNSLYIGICSFLGK